jgi:hypothetical protein
MFLRQNNRRKNGKTHRYFSVVENRRTGSGTSTQRQVLYLGEINDSQQEEPGGRRSRFLTRTAASIAS